MDLAGTGTATGESAQERWPVLHGGPVVDDSYWTIKRSNLTDHLSNFWKLMNEQRTRKSFVSFRFAIHLFGQRIESCFGRDMYVPFEGEALHQHHRKLCS